MFNSHPINKNLANEDFKYAMWQARRDALLSKLIGKPSYLKNYEDVRADVTLQERYLGVMEIPVEKITGTVGRYDDFDGRFRPLKNHLRERWVNVALYAQRKGWPAIEVLKVGDEYFVIDGHHRTSYARSIGMAFIDADVREMVSIPVEGKMKIIDVQMEMFSEAVPANGELIRECGDCCGVLAS